MEEKEIHHPPVSTPEYRNQSCDRRRRSRNRAVRDEERQKRSSTHTVYVPRTPLSILLSLIAHASLALCAIVDDKLCLEIQCDMLQDTKAAFIDDKLSKIHKDKDRIKSVLKTYFEVTTSKEYESTFHTYLFETISDAIRRIANNDKTALLPQYWMNAGYSIQFGAEMYKIQSNTVIVSSQLLKNRASDEPDYDAKADDEFIEQFRHQPLQTTRNENYGGLDEIPSQNMDQFSKNDNGNYVYKSKYSKTKPLHGHNRSTNKADRRRACARNKSKRYDAERKLFIHKQLSKQCTSKCVEYSVSNGHALFDYILNTWVMQLNDDQVDDGQIRFIHSDLHCVYTGQVLYGVIVLNDEEYSEECRWKLRHLMTVDEILPLLQYQFPGLSMNQLRDLLPVSSRKMKWCKTGLRTPPVGLNVDLISRTNFADDNQVGKKWNMEGCNGMVPPDDCLIFSNAKFKELCIESTVLVWAGKMLPIVYVKGKRQCIEWILFIRICEGKSVGISVAYFASNKRWRITCIHCDPVRLWYQHRLVGLHFRHDWYWTYDEVKKYITTSVRIEP
eukprot:118157_1